MKKLIIGSIFLLLASAVFGQTLNNKNSGVVYPSNITPYSIIDLKNGDTLCWYWNAAQVKDWVLYHSPASGGFVSSITAGSGLSGGTITTTGTIALKQPYFDSSFTFTGGAASRTTTIPSGYTNAVISARNLTTPTTPFHDEFWQLSYSISTTTLTIYMVANLNDGSGAPGTANVADNYQITYHLIK